MEGLPSLPVITPDLRLTAGALPPDFSAKINEYILTHYNDDPTKYKSAIEEIESLRLKIGRPIPDVECACQMKRYFSQLMMMKNRFPMEETDPLSIPFSWTDKSADTPSSIAYKDINFELACVMFNIGGVHAQIAANESRSDFDSIKNAFTHFQYAAWPFQYIRDKMSAARYSSADFEPALLTWYADVMLAQAQECLLKKSLIDHRKNTIIARIAVYLRDCYKQCREHLDSSGLNDIVSSSKFKEWLRTCEVKSELYAAIAMISLGQQADEDKKMGYRLVYYGLAADHMRKATKAAEKDKRESLHQAVIFLNDIVYEKETNAKKENEFIYHDRIPKLEDLPGIEGVTMVKAVGFDPADRSVGGDDLFASLLPMNVIRAVSVYSEEKAKFKREVAEKVATKDKELDDYLATLQLDEINIDQSIDELKLPDMLLERSAAFNSQPDAFPDLLDKLQRVGDCALQADQKLSDLRNRLCAINSPSLVNDEGFKAIQKELTRISDHHVLARSNNTELQRAIAEQSENLKVLTLPLQELNRYVSGPIIKPSETAEGSQLKKMLDKVDEMRAQRSKLVESLWKDIENDDISTKLLAEKDSDNTDLYEKELKKHDGTVKLIELNLDAQERILKALTEANAGFADVRKQVMEVNSSRTEQILALTSAFDVYSEVLQKAEEGLKFYSNLFAIVKSLSNAIEGIEAIYQEEKAKKAEEEKRIEERARELRRNREAQSSALKGMLGCDSTISANVSGTGTSLAGVPPIVGGGRLRDYLPYYRNKLANQGPRLEANIGSAVVQPLAPALSSVATLESGGLRSEKVPNISFMKVTQYDTRPEASVPPGVPSYIPSISSAAGVLPMPGINQQQPPQPGGSTARGNHAAVSISHFQQIHESIPGRLTCIPASGMSSVLSSPHIQPVSGHLFRTSQSSQLRSQVAQFAAPDQISSKMPSSGGCASEANASQPSSFRQLQPCLGTHYVVSPAVSQSFQPNHSVASGSSLQYHSKQLSIPTSDVSRSAVTSLTGPSSAERYLHSSAVGQSLPSGLPPQNPVFQQCATSYGQASQQTGLSQNPSKPAAFGTFDPSTLPNSNLSVRSQSSIPFGNVPQFNATVLPQKNDIPGSAALSSGCAMTQSNANGSSGFSMQQIHSSLPNTLPSATAVSPWHQGLQPGLVAGYGLSSTHSGFMPVLPSPSPHPSNIPIPRSIAVENRTLVQEQQKSVTISSHNHSIHSTAVAQNFQPDLVRNSSTPVQQLLQKHNVYQHPAVSSGDLMSVPLDTKLPEPLVPSVAAKPDSSNNSASGSSEARPGLMASQHLQKQPSSAPVSSSNYEGNSRLLSNVQNQFTEANSSGTNTQSPTPRPAAAVAPIVQSSDPSLACSPVLAMTNVTSISYDRNNPTSNTSLMDQRKVADDSAGDKSRLSLTAPSQSAATSLTDLMNPTTFCLGEADLVRLEKRQMREKFRAEGTAAQMPPLDASDPFNSLDSHFFLRK
ncbi:hypothetical protein AB6A40_005080 [Gnathostoma spinigerum]|uniref:BRO1 domain-containing protein n=1 Tax=Gnathostoma spinigerum TaxID=75299 RepID=A0ABD6ELR8_9BILA